MKRRADLHSTLQRRLKGEPCNRSCVYNYEPNA